MFSIFTPTNNHRYLRDLYVSLRSQTYTNWEWIVLANGKETDLAYETVKAIAITDKRVKPFYSNITNHTIGALKYLACSKSTGDYLVELDHDDLLPSYCLQELDVARQSGAEFIYSDWCGFKEDGSFEQYGTNWGWDNYEFNYDDKLHKAVKAFEPSARSFSEVYFAPNHIRAWSKNLYDKLGGHDITLKVADDHDLVCRTYLSGAKIAYINKPLYFYRIHGTNSVKLFNKDIQTQQAANRDKYVHDLVIEECRRLSMPIVVVNDKLNCKYADINFEHSKLAESLSTWADNSIGLIQCYDVFQLFDGQTNIELLKEMYRVLRPDGWIFAAVPSTDGRGAFQDLRHKSFWNENSWLYWSQESYASNYYDTKDPATPKFQCVRRWTGYSDKQQEADRISFTYADLIALKGQRVPGPKHFNVLNN